jgi:hypothetical protein
MPALPTPTNTVDVPLSNSNPGFHLGSATSPFVTVIPSAETVDASPLNPESIASNDTHRLLEVGQRNAGYLALRHRYSVATTNPTQAPQVRVFGFIPNRDDQNNSSTPAIYPQPSESGEWVALMDKSGNILHTLDTESWNDGTEGASKETIVDLMGCSHVVVMLARIATFEETEDVGSIEARLVTYS